MKVLVFDTNAPILIDDFESKEEVDVIVDEVKTDYQVDTFKYDDKEDRLMIFVKGE